MIKLEIRKNAYYDSVTLMIISKDVKAFDGVNEALVGMGTDLNREIAENLGLNAEGFEAVTANDFFIAVQYHPEFKSRPNRAHAIFREFVRASLEHKNK